MQLDCGYKDREGEEKMGQGKGVEMWTVDSRVQQPARLQAQHLERARFTFHVMTPNQCCCLVQLQCFQSSKGKWRLHFKPAKKQAS